MLLGLLLLSWGLTTGLLADRTQMLRDLLTSRVLLLQCSNGSDWFELPGPAVTSNLSFAFKLIRVTQPELIQSQKSQESQSPEEAKPANSKTVAPESTHPGRLPFQWCCEPFQPAVEQALPLADDNLWLT